MTQYSYDYESLGLIGSICTTEPHDIISVENELRAQVTNLEYNGITTDGAYTVTVVGDDGSSATSLPFTASSNTAAQICAGIVAKMIATPQFAGLLADGDGAAVVTTDNVEISFAARGVTYTVTTDSPGSEPTQSNTTTAGYTEIAAGIILQANGTGGFTTTYTDAALALGVTIRNSDLVQPLQPSSVSGYTGPAMMAVMAMGATLVTVASGVTVYRGEKVYFNPTAKTWSNATTGSHVLVEGAQWRTTGTSKQRVWVRLPSEN
jgi:hypothetical protein